jgi:hypothetical protein
MERRWIVRALVAAVVAGSTCLLAVPPAFADVVFGATSAFPSTTTVGATGLVGHLTVDNSSTAPEDTSTIKLTAIDLTPSCGSTHALNGVCQSPDPGVFQISPTGTGETGTGCPGTTFTTSIVDASTGQVLFTPSSTVTLSVDGPATERASSISPSAS